MRRLTIASTIVLLLCGSTALAVTDADIVHLKARIADRQTLTQADLDLARDIRLATISL
jgi:hypothetical protein